MQDREALETTLDHSLTGSACSLRQIIWNPEHANISLDITGRNLHHCTYSSLLAYRVGLHTVVIPYKESADVPQKPSSRTYLIKEMSQTNMGAAFKSPSRRPSVSDKSMLPNRHASNTMLGCSQGCS